MRRRRRRRRRRADGNVEMTRGRGGKSEEEVGDINAEIEEDDVIRAGTGKSCREKGKSRR